MNKSKMFSGMQVQMVKLLLLTSLLMIIFCSTFTQAAIQNVSLKVFTDEDYSDIWLGISTGGYRLLVEQGTSYVIRVFIKNGMPDRSLHNIMISPDNFAFPINSMVPEKIEQLKPMEIAIVYVNISVPSETPLGTYSVMFDVLSDEFPKGVFKLDSELKVVRKIRKELYPIYTALILGILILLIYRKWWIGKVNEKMKRARK